MGDRIRTLLMSRNGEQSEYTAQVARKPCRLSMLLSGRYSTMVERIMCGAEIVFDAADAPVPVDVVNDLLARHFSTMRVVQPGECIRVFVVEEHSPAATTITAAVVE